MDATKRSVAVQCSWTVFTLGANVGVSQSWTPTLKCVGHVGSVNSDTTISYRCLDSHRNSDISKANVSKKNQ